MMADKILVGGSFKGYLLPSFFFPCPLHFNFCAPSNQQMEWRQITPKSKYYYVLQALLIWEALNQFGNTKFNLVPRSIFFYDSFPIKEIYGPPWRIVNTVGSEKLTKAALEKFQHIQYQP